MSFVIFLVALLCIAVTVAVAALLSRNRNVLPPRRSTRALDRARPVTTSAGTNNANAAGFGFGALVCRRFVSGVCRAWRIACKQLASSNQNRSSTVLVQAKEDKEDGVPSPCNQVLPLSVNYHFTRQCNYSCGFCFHTAKTSFVLPIEEAKRGLQMLKNAGMKKINFSGGEPFLTKRGYYVGELVRWCKEELELDSVSIVSNGSLITEKWFREFGEHLDILAVSCDSFNEETNRKIGRFQRSRNHLDSLYRVRDWCQQYEVAFKINSVVNTWNWNEDMREEILRLNPVRWKVFQCLLIGGENAGPGALRNAEQFVITDEQFRSFLERHKEVSQLVPESNEKMRDSYLILDEYMRFLDCTRGSKDPSRSVLDVGVEEAIKFSGFDEAMFFRRGGRYMWSKADMDLSW